MKNVDEERNYFVEKIEQNELMSKKQEKVCPTLISIFAFVSLVGIPNEITSSEAGSKICAITAAIKRYKSIIIKKKKKHDKVVLLAKTKLNSIEVVTSKALTDSYIIHDEFISVNNAIEHKIIWKEK